MLGGEVVVSEELVEIVPDLGGGLPPLAGELGVDGLGGFPCMLPVFPFKWLALGSVTGWKDTSTSRPPVFLGRSVRSARWAAAIAWTMARPTPCPSAVRVRPLRRWKG